MGVSIASSAIDAGCEVYWASEGRRSFTRDRAEAAGLRDAGTIARLCELCPIIISVCPPEFAWDVARAVVATGFQGILADVNALTPQNKVKMATLGLKFADGGIIGLPSRIPGETTLFLSGPAAQEVAECFTGGAISAVNMGPEVGRATALKILFAAYNKGSIALFAALYAAAEQYGVLQELQGQFVHRGLSLEKIEAQITRAAPKAWRWVAEMHEISESLEAVGMPGDFHQGAAKIYERLVGLKDQSPSLEETIRILRP
jgi:3-hydroxyisobutyrate dehydrogenase-like beta-hydroxyacid dehydrogenase